MQGVAVVGMGYWGKNLVRNFHELCVLKTVCEQMPERERIVRETYPDVSFSSEYQSVLSDPEISAVALATPAALHYAMAKQALQSGKDVFVEKPLCLTVREGEQIVELAADRKRILMVGHILRYHPAVVELKRLINEGGLGRIQYVYSNRLNIGKIRTEENILWSFAPHDISAILGLLDEEPDTVMCQGAAYLNHNVPDVTMSQFTFQSGVHGHIFVSWLHPFKEQRLVVVGSEKMAVFDDMAADKLLLYPHRVAWKDRIPTAIKAEASRIQIPAGEPLSSECRHFLDCIATRSQPLTNGLEGLRVLRILSACQEALEKGGQKLTLKVEKPALHYFVHRTAVVDEGAEIGAGTKIWHFSHVMKGARIGERCILGQNVNVDGGTEVGNNVKVQNNVSIYTGVVIEDDVFLGPSCVLTNVTNPRSQVLRHSLYEKTHLLRGCSIGANATIVCGVRIGRYAFVGAGAVVTRDVPDYALMLGNPARQRGWMSRHGHRLDKADSQGIMICPESGFRYREVSPGVLRCLDLDENGPLPAELSKGTKCYDEFRTEGRRSPTPIDS